MKKLCASTMFLLLAMTVSMDAFAAERSQRSKTSCIRRALALLGIATSAMSSTSNQWELFDMCDAAAPATPHEQKWCAPSEADAAKYGEEWASSFALGCSKENAANCDPRLMGVVVRVNQFGQPEMLLSPYSIFMSASRRMFGKIWKNAEQISDKKDDE